jgi:hypothetical protein
MTLAPLILLLVGIGWSFRKNGGGLLEWYFVAYEGMFLFWPWDFELRFLLPVAPLAFLYMWRGAVVLWSLAQKHDVRWWGASGILIAVAGIMSSVVWGWGVPKPQPRWCIAAWLLVGSVAMILWARGSRAVHKLSSYLNQTALAIGGATFLRSQVLGCVVITCLFAVGITGQVKIGLADVQVTPDANPEIQAAQWVRWHTGRAAVVMARDEALVYHYSNREVIWFPPSTDARLLMDGIRRYHVQDILVVDRAGTYWKPSEANSFEALSHAYPGAFVLIHKGPHYEIFALSSHPA